MRLQQHLFEVSADQFLPPSTQVKSRPHNIPPKQAQKLAVSMAEKLPYLEPAPKYVDCTAEASDRPFIIHDIGDTGAVYIAVHLGVYQVTMPPIAERAGHLHIAEMMIGGVVVNERKPVQPDGGKRYRAETQQNARAPVGCIWTGVGRLQFHPVDASVLPGRHQPRQVQRIGEKSEDASQREGNPLFGRERELRPSLRLEVRSSPGRRPSVMHGESVDGIWEPQACRLRFIIQRAALTVRFGAFKRAESAPFHPRTWKSCIRWSNT